MPFGSEDGGGEGGVDVDGGSVEAAMTEADERECEKEEREGRNGGATTVAMGMVIHKLLNVQDQGLAPSGAL